MNLALLKTPGGTNYTHWTYAGEFACNVRLSTFLLTCYQRWKARGLKAMIYNPAVTKTIYRRRLKNQ